MYWNQEHQQALEQYYWCYTAATSAETRHTIFNTILYEPLQQLAKKALNHYNHSASFTGEDNQQDLLLFMYDKLLNKLNPELLQGANNFLYICCKRYIVTNKIIKAKKTVSVDDNYSNDVDVNTITYVSNDALTNIHKQETIQAIQLALDNKINEQKVLNKSNTIYLLLLKQYLIDNDFDALGFKDYVMKAMDINLGTYRAISSRVRISTLIYKEEKQYRKYKKNNNRCVFNNN